MVLWAIFWGGLIGAFVPEGAVIGGALLGSLAGLWLRWAVQHEFAELAARAGAQASQAASQPLPRRSKGFELPADALRGSSLGGAPIDAPPAQSEAAPFVANPSMQVASGIQVSASYAPSVNAAAAAIEAPLRPMPRLPPLPTSSAAPNAFEKDLAAAKSWLLGGNTIARVGLVILFIGLSFLARYAAAAGLLPVQLRLAAIGAVGIALLVVGFRQRSDKPGFAQALQGGGVAVLYLTVFAAFRLYQLLLAVPAFALMAFVCALGCTLALLQNARSLAFVAFTGGFAVPLLLASGQGNHVVLFSYFLLLNVAILFIAYRRSWRELNVLGFVVTFVVASSWGALRYVPEQYASTQPFLIGFLLIYLSMAVLYARNTPTRLGSAVDSTLVFGTPLVGFGLQAGLVEQFDLGTAYSALGFAAVYLLSAKVLAQRALDNYRVLIECFIALGVGFATLAVPLALDAQWTSAVWALEGAGAFWVGMRQARWMPRAFGLVLQLAAALAYLTGNQQAVSALPLLHPAFMGAILLALPALLLAWWLRQPLAQPPSQSGAATVYASLEWLLAAPAYLYGFAFWCVAFTLEFDRSVPAQLGAEPSVPTKVFGPQAQVLLTLLAVVSSAGLSLWLGSRQQWAVATWPSRFTVVVLAGSLLGQLGNEHRVLEGQAWLLWLVVLVMHYAMLRHHDRSQPSVWLHTFNHWVHASSVWLIAVLIADALWFVIDKAELWRSSWAGVLLLVSAVAALAGLVLWAGRANQADRTDCLRAFSWPLLPHASAYHWTAAAPLAALVFVGALLLALISAGRTPTWPYVPLLNPTELTLALGVGALLRWRQVVRGARLPSAGSSWVQSSNASVALALLGFVVLNTVWLRIAHHFFDVRWDASELFSSFVVQTGSAILWSLLALALMLTAQRRSLRPLWLTGASLLGLVVVKLVIIDLANADGVERIVVFIAVGALMLLVGYLVPMPPKAAAGEPEGVRQQGSAG